MVNKMKMTKIYLTAIIAVLCNVTFGQGFFIPTDYRGAFASAPTAMWTDGWTNWDPQNTVYPAATVTISTSITNNTTWTAGNTYLLQGQIYVKNGATLTIEPGTVVLGDKASVGSGLFITQGSKLVAVGTESQPIVFTSNQAAGARAAGDWGGVILMGRGANNNAGGIANVEGIAPTADTQFGGGTSPDNDDNSGSLQYVRIEFPGYVYQTNKEINGLTLGSVGRATTIDHIQVSFSNDDGYEWFGGAVNCRYLVSYRNLDDDFDCDNGFSGNIQFGLVVRDPNIADNPSVSTSEGFEVDNDASGSTNSPQTSATFSNITLVGPYRGSTSNTIATGYRRGARIRRNAALKIHNSVFMDFQRGIHVDGTACEGNATNDILKYKNNVVAGASTGKVCEINSGSTFAIRTWFGTNENDSVDVSTGILTTPYDYLNPDYRPVNGSILLSNIAYDDAAISPMTLTAPATTTSIEYCVGETPAILSATATNGNSLSWFTTSTGGVGSTTAPTPSTVAAGTFTYYVCQVGSQLGSAGVYDIEGPRTEITVTINANPTAPVVTPSGATSFCTGNSITLTSSQSTGIEWNDLSSSTTATITVSTTGDYSVTYTDANNCSSTSLPISVNVSSTPIPTITASGSLDFCEGDSVILVSTVGDTYVWSDNSTNDSLIVYDAGTYTVTTTNTDACLGVGQSGNIVVTVNPVPVAAGSFTTSGNVVTFSSTGSTGATSYSWDFGDGTNSSQASPAHAYVANGSYDVVLTAINGDCSSTYTITVVISVGIEEISQFEHVSLYPNPAQNEATISLEMMENTNIEVVVLNLSGQVVTSVFNGSLNAGLTELKINTSDLSNGMYYTRISTENAVKNIKMNIAK